MSSVSADLKAAVLAALAQVEDPVLGKDLVQLDMIKDLEIRDGEVRLRILLTTPAHPNRDEIEAAARKAIVALEGVQSVEVTMDADVPEDGRVREAGAPIKNAIAVGSGKGGVGKTTVAVNLAVALAETGATVGLLDADVYGPNVPTMLGVDQMPPPREKKMVPAEAFGVKVMSIAFMVKPGQPLIWRGPMLHSAIRQFITDVEWGELDYLIVDLPPGTGDAALSLTQSMPLSGAVIVTLPQNISLEDASRGLEMFRTMEVPILGVLENMSYLELEDGSRIDVFGTGGGQRLATETGSPFLGTVPMDPAVRLAGDSGVPVVISHPDSASAQALIHAAKEIAANVTRAVLERGGDIQLEIMD
ncbi:MAG: Mrp/NBP35 family ATP-binding protein [Anaerolineales bacterium]